MTFRLYSQTSTYRIAGETKSIRHVRNPLWGGFLLLLVKVGTWTLIRYTVEFHYNAAQYNEFPLWRPSSAIPTFRNWWILMLMKPHYNESMFRSRAISYNGVQFFRVSLCRGWTAFFIWLLLPHICNWFFSRYPVHNQSFQGMMTTLWRHDDVQHTSWWRHRDVCCTSSWCIGQSGADCTYVIPRVKIRWNHEIILKWVQALWGCFLLSRALFFQVSHTSHFIRLPSIYLCVGIFCASPFRQSWIHTWLTLLSATSIDTVAAAE